MVEPGQEAQQGSGSKKGAVFALVALVAIVAVAVLAYSMLPQMHASAPNELTPADEVDPFAKEAIAACTIKDNDDKPLTLGDITAKSHKPIIMNVWASWCPHCVEEMDDYQALFDEYGDQVSFVMLDLNDTPAEPDLARAFVKEHGYTFPIYFDSNSSVLQTFAITGIPISAVLSAEGDLVLMHTGTIDYSTMKSAIDAILKE